MMEDQRRSYLAYLLRLWQVKSKGGTTWRVTLQSPQSGDRIGFDRLEDLFDYLREQTGESSDYQEGESPTRDEGLGEEN